MPKKVSGLTELTTLKDDDFIEVVDSAESNLALKSKKLKGSTIKAYIGTTNSGNFDEWDIATTYTAAPPSTYVSHLGNIYEFVKATSDLGTAPGTDPLIWLLTSAGAFSHEKNKDQYLDYAGPNQIAVADIASESYVGVVADTKIDISALSNIAIATGHASIDIGGHRIKYYLIQSVTANFILDLVNPVNTCCYRIIIQQTGGTAITITLGTGFNTVRNLNAGGAVISSIVLASGVTYHELVFWTYSTSGNTFLSYTPAIIDDEYSIIRRSSGPDGHRWKFTFDDFGMIQLPGTDLGV